MNPKCKVAVDIEMAVEGMSTQCDSIEGDGLLVVVGNDGDDTVTMGGNVTVSMIASVISAIVENCGKEMVKSALNVLTLNLIGTLTN